VYVAMLNAVATNTLLLLRLGKLLTQKYLQFICRERTLFAEHLIVFEKMSLTKPETYKKRHKAL
jgi:hypothetical protein